tara:strand:+ start:451 stop:645 length:195 start_codon:yes stop_codon:yes gene_type:complete
MSAEHKYKEENQYIQEVEFKEKKVNLNDLVNRMNLEKKKEKKNTYILSAAAISAVTVFGIILTL